MARRTDYESSLSLRNILVNGKRTSIRLEPELWNALELLAEREERSMHELCSYVALRYQPHPFTSAVRVYLVETLLAQSKYIDPFIRLVPSFHGQAA